MYYPNPNQLPPVSQETPNPTTTPIPTPILVYYPLDGKLGAQQTLGETPSSQALWLAGTRLASAPPCKTGFIPTYGGDTGPGLCWRTPGPSPRHPRCPLVPRAGSTEAVPPGVGDSLVHPRRRAFVGGTLQPTEKRRLLRGHGSGQRPPPPPAGLTLHSKLCQLGHSLGWGGA